MNYNVARITFRGEKNCFIVPPKELNKTSHVRERLQAYEIQYGKDGRAYVSAGGETGYKDAVLQINGVFASKLGLKEEEVILQAIPAVPRSQKVFIDPQSVDDWEILERHADIVENNLMNQIRVVWKGEVFPFWVDKLVLFLKISATEPNETCVILNEDTEVIISPKVRGNFTGPKSNLIKHPTDAELNSQSNLDRKSVSPISPRRTSSLQANPTTGHVPNHSTPNDFSGNHKKHRSSWNPFRLVSGFLAATGSYDTNSNFYIPQTSREENEEYGNVDKNTSVTPEKEERTFRKPFGGLNFKFRVQSLKENFRCDKTSDSEINKLSEDYCKSSLYFKQPNIVFVNSEDVQEQISIKNMEMPDTFYAKLTRLSSPSDLYTRAEEQLANQKKEKQDKLDSSNDSLKSSKTDKKEKQLNCIVRVVILTKKGLHSQPEFIQLIAQLLDEQPCLRGHVIIPDILRRLMNLDTTRQIWLQSIDMLPTQALGFDLQPVASLPKNVGNYQIQEAFKKWVIETSSPEVPFVMFPGVMIKMNVFTDITVDLQILYHDQKMNEGEKAVYSTLSCNNIEDLSFYIKNPTCLDNSKWPILPMLAYMDIKSIDPTVPKEKFEDMGGIDEIAENAINAVEVCLASKPLSDSMFRRITPGLRNGMILITGPKGSGKTMFAKALCRRHAELPNLGYVVMIDCKPLRGKRPDAILKILQMAFDEASWRQPSVILLDDLENVMPAPSGPEAEMSGEAIYGARVAEVLRDIMRKEICDGTRIAVIATAVARNAIHPLLVNSRGTHFVQTTLSINPPDKKRRRQILTSIINSRDVISPNTLNKIDLDWLQCRTEGYVASDLMNLVSRALHAYWIKHGHGSESDGIVLGTEEFKDAIEGFTPASIRNVPLHTAGELGWEDVGGLNDIKKVLIETLQWPSKYPKLFSMCPLRLRSGLLLYGAPGTGKTLLAGVVAKECGLNFISIKGPELLNKYIGASEQAVRDTFVRAQSARPCILFFDEFDSIAPRRGHDNTGVTDRVVNQLLTQLDGVEGLEGVYVLAATSRPDLIDPALLRPGRLDKCLRCDIPNLEERKAILKALTRKITLHPEVNLDYFAEKCENFTGADFKALLYNAQLEAIHEMAGPLKRKDNFSYSNQKSPSYLRTSRRRSSYGLLSKAAEMERESTNFTSDIIYMKNLSEDSFELTEELEDHLTQQVKQIRNRLTVHKKTENVTTAESLFSPMAASKASMIVMTQEDLEKAVDKTRPSVPAEERFKYQRIYENFVSSRGGNFGQSTLETVGQKQTLA